MLSIARTSYRFHKQWTTKNQVAVVFDAGRTCCSWKWGARPATWPAADQAAWNCERAIPLDAWLCCAGLDRRMTTSCLLSNPTVYWTLLLIYIEQLSRLINQNIHTTSHSLLLQYRFGCARPCSIRAAVRTEDNCARRTQRRPQRRWPQRLDCGRHRHRRRCSRRSCQTRQRNHCHCCSDWGEALRRSKCISKLTRPKLIYKALMRTRQARTRECSSRSLLSTLKQWGSSISRRCQLGLWYHAQVARAHS